VLARVGLARGPADPQMGLLTATTGPRGTPLTGARAINNLSVGDVDNDGSDEIVYGACCIDHTGKGLYATGLRHGDAMHLSDMDPDRPGWRCGTSTRRAPVAGGGEFRDAWTGGEDLRTVGHR